MEKICSLYSQKTAHYVNRIFVFVCHIFLKQQTKYGIGHKNQNKKMEFVRFIKKDKTADFKKSHIDMIQCGECEKKC